MLLAESFDAKQAPKPREGMCPHQRIPRAGGDAKAPGPWRRRGREVPAPGTAPTQAPSLLLPDFAEQRRLLSRAGELHRFGIFFLGWRASALCTGLTKHCFRVKPCPPGLGRAGRSAQRLPVPLSALRAAQFLTFHFAPAAALTTSSKRGRPPSCRHARRAMCWRSEPARRKAQARWKLLRSFFSSLLLMYLDPSSQTRHMPQTSPQATERSASQPNTSSRQEGSDLISADIRSQDNLGEDPCVCSGKDTSVGKQSASPC